MTFEEFEGEHERLKLERAQYIKLDPEQLLAIMTAILVAGKCFSDQNSESVVRAGGIAQEIFERIIWRSEYVDWSEDRFYKAESDCSNCRE